MAVNDRPKRPYMIKPIVEPEEHNIAYEPIVYNLVQEVVYEDPEEMEMKNEAIGVEENTFDDRNISVDRSRNN